LKRGRVRPEHGERGVLGPWAVIVWFYLAPATALFASMELARHPWLLVQVAATFVLLLPWPLARLVLIPLGRVRLAYWLTYASDVTFRRDRRGGAALAGAWALARQRVRDEADTKWILRRLAAAAPLQGASLFASGLVLAALDDLEGARALIQGVLRFPGPDGRRVVRQLACDWLAALSAERGDWETVARLGRTRGQGGRATWLLSGAAQVLLREPAAPGRLGLWWRWVLAPRRRATLPLVRRALAARETPAPEPDEDAPAPRVEGGMGVPAARGSTLDTALLRHAWALGQPARALRAKDVRAVTRSWDLALEDAATFRWLVGRTAELGSLRIEHAIDLPVLDRVVRTVADDLAGVALAARVRLASLDDEGEIAERVRESVRERLLSDVEAASDAIRRRVDRRIELEVVDERREWRALCALYARGVRLGGADCRRLAFAKVYPDAAHFALWLWEVREQRHLANAIFRWLLGEAEAVGDAQAAEAQRRNASHGV
jgi:hypothetical protein